MASEMDQVSEMIIDMDHHTPLGSNLPATPMPNDFCMSPEEFLSMYGSIFNADLSEYDPNEKY